ncbi:hypothetical protein TNCV_673511 [Trichonephila clavipes]|uniref:Uncharacterized protein n=1 Tax=Trichonephila clavipes TaxID=2585209 RepID=A0A8X7BI40_TRICX|nr:hypothetical protein TNCV_673511 [Trichonephila clavipes]
MGRFNENHSLYTTGLRGHQDSNSRPYRSSTSRDHDHSLIVSRLPMQDLPNILNIADSLMRMRTSPVCYTRAFSDGPRNFEPWSSDEDETSSLGLKRPMDKPALPPPYAILTPPVKSGSRSSRIVLFLGHSSLPSTALGRQDDERKRLQG